MRKVGAIQAAADTLVYIVLPYSVSYWFVTKHFLKGLFIKPEGRPDGSSILNVTLHSDRTLKLCPTCWNDEFSSQLMGCSSSKKVYMLKTVYEWNDFSLVKTR